jgi:hypothetical protein
MDPRSGSATLIVTTSLAHKTSNSFVFLLVCEKTDTWASPVEATPPQHNPFVGRTAHRLSLKRKNSQQQMSSQPEYSFSPIEITPMDYGGLHHDTDTGNLVKRQLFSDVSTATLGMSNCFFFDSFCCILTNSRHINHKVLVPASYFIAHDLIAPLVLGLVFGKL